LPLLEHAFPHPLLAPSQLAPHRCVLPPPLFEGGGGGGGGG
jgi:hypothetical protein